MLRIRTREKNAFAEAQLCAFDDRLVEVLRRSWARAFAEQGEPAVRGFVRSWRPVVEAWGIQKERDVAHALNVVFAVVTDFGEDPLKVPWVREVVDDRRLTGIAKAQRLYVGLYAAYEAEGDRERLAAAQEQG